MQGSGWQGKLRRFAGLDAADQWLFLRAVTALAVARVGLAIVPFERRMAGWPEREAGDSNGKPDPELLRRVAFAITSAAANVPWRSDCLPKAIAARALLKGHGYVPTIHLGVERQGDDALAGHAWLTCGNAVVIGGEELGRYTEVHRFTG